MSKRFDGTYDQSVMKTSNTSTFLCLAAALTATGLHGQERVLYPHPDASSEPVATVAPDDSRFHERGPVVDPAAAADGWQWGEFEGDFTGYVPDAKIGKDLYPVVGALIHAAPDIDSPVLGSVTEDDLVTDAIEILDRGEWWTLFVSKTVPVYYLEAIVTGEAVDEELVDLADDAQQVRLQEAAPAAPRQVVPAPEIEEDASAREPTVNAVAGTIGSTFRGTLRRTSSRFFFFNPPFPYELIDRNGERVAYLDLEAAILRQPVSGYLNRNVSVFGTWSTVEDSRAIVIRVRNLNELPAY